MFEADEGEGEAPLRAFNPYGLAKTVTWHHLRFAAERRGLTVGKFVVPVPFGPLEKEGFTAGLIRAWLRDEVAVVRRPRLVRDHVPVRFLAGAYVRFARLLAVRRGTLRASPGCFALPLAGFARKLAAAMRPRLGLGCRFAPAAPQSGPTSRWSAATSSPCASWRTRPRSRRCGTSTPPTTGARRPRMGRAARLLSIYS